MPLCVGTVVEGHGDVEAVPILVRRVAIELIPDVAFTTSYPVRVPKGRLVKPGELERAVGLAALKCGTDRAIMVLVDADDDCPFEVAPRLLERVRRIAGHRSAVVMAKYEFEAWFLASAESLRGRRGLSETVEAPADPETIRGAKEWLTRHMRSPYSETLDQPSLVSAMDITQARSCNSFDKFCRDLVTLLSAGGHHG